MHFKLKFLHNKHKWQSTLLFQNIVTYDVYTPNPDAYVAILASSSYPLIMDGYFKIVYGPITKLHQLNVPPHRSNIEYHLLVN